MLKRVDQLINCINWYNGIFSINDKLLLFQRYQENNEQASHRPGKCICRSMHLATHTCNQKIYKELSISQ